MWDPINLNGQCRSCNGKEHWSEDKETYRKNLIAKVGQEEFDALQFRKNQVFKVSVLEAEELYKYWKEKLEESKQEYYVWLEKNC